MRVCASHPGKPYFSVEGRKLLPGKGACGCEGLRLGAGSLRLIPGKPYSSVEGRKPIAGKKRRRLWEFAPHTRESLISPSRGANFCREKAPVAVRVCALEPGVCASFRESLILPLRGANFLPGKGAGGRVSLRPIPRKALFFRRGAQTFHPQLAARPARALK